MERFTISLEESLAQQFDQLVVQAGYQNRSEAVRDLIRGAIESDRQRDPPAGHCVANLSYVYNHHERELAERTMKDMAERGIKSFGFIGFNDAFGDGWLKDAFELEKLKEFQNDTEFLKAVGASKRANKERLAAYVKAETGLVIDPNTVFDVQVKRFHAYKRQLMNIMKVMDIYNRRIADPNFHVTPTTFIFSGKAASSYTFAKETIRLINSVADVINNDPRVNEVMKVCFIPNFRVSNAQLIYPAA